MKHTAHRDDDGAFLMDENGGDLVSYETFEHEQQSEQNALRLGFWPSSWVAVVRNRITIAHGGHGYTACADRVGYWY